MRIANRYMHPLEVEHIAGFATEDEQWSAFMSLWTVKEAFVKAQGLGFSGAKGFKGFHVDLEEDKNIAEPLIRLTGLPVMDSTSHVRVTGANNVGGCTFLVFRPSPDHVATLCVKDTAGMPTKRLQRVRMYRVGSLGQWAPMEDCDSIVLGGGPFAEVVQNATVRQQR
ncbi:unnamed protein product [Ostreobium quekettii]|uniref:holo-[acyl-carrier-protein] synthase n=1 Tax=Ostreobium quekettii TaxID=121088 RepID=A0A8S1IQ18_9CHLO|nr:unnamed protein product [Ostreobium quekettii]